MATTISCLIVTILIIVSLVNLLLLLHVIMHSCSSLKKPRNSYAPHHRIPYVRPRGYTKTDPKPSPDLLHALVFGKEHRYMGALVLSHEETVEFVCGAAVVGQYWAITSGRCWDSIKTYPLSFIKIVMASKQHDLDDFLVESNTGIVLLKSVAVFKHKVSAPLALAAKHFKYLANSSGEMYAWTRGIKGEYLLEVVAVKLAWYIKCKSSYGASYEQGMFCVEEDEKEERCYSDFGRVVIRKGVLVGVISSEDFGCDSKPNLFWKVGEIEKWAKSLEKERKISLGLVFKEVR